MKLLRPIALLFVLIPFCAEHARSQVKDSSQIEKHQHAEQDKTEVEKEVVKPTIVENDTSPKNPMVKDSTMVDSLIGRKQETDTLKKRKEEK
ncbi:MAG: hypothetical protein R3275_06310 [Saprospiraceae bacterium]|nr:hypothetical protein [Saprospiraceae bacterium]